MNTISRRTAAFVAWAGAVLGLATPALAQDGLVANGHMLSAVADFGRDLGPAPLTATGPNVGGWRYTLVGHRYVDRRTGRGRDLPDLAMVVGTDPVRPRVFIRSPGEEFATIDLLDVSTGGSRLLAIVGPRETARADSVKVAASVDRVFIDLAETLFIANPSREIEHRVHVLSGATGEELPGAFTFRGPASAPWLVTPDGARVYAALTHGLAVFDVASGRSHALPVPAAAMVWDDLNERLLATAEATVSALSRDGVLLGTAHTPACVAVAVSAHTGRLYVREYQPSPDGAMNVMRVYDSSAYAPLGVAALPSFNDCAVQVLAAPGPPRALAASVSGHDVTLSWVNVGSAGHFVIDVGLAPGQTAVTLPSNADTRLAVTGVPSGTYYVRVRGGNEVGGGRPSNEVTVVVP